MEALLTSAGVVALAEIGDKTQLLAILLAARFRRPLPIIAGIFVATLVNHAGAALVGKLTASVLDGPVLTLALGLGFLAMAAWALIPDKDEGVPEGPASAGAFLATTIAFFLVEMGDKTQIATVALAARFQSVFAVAAGTTIGMMAANVPAVLLGDVILRRAPLKLIRAAAAAVFALLGAVTLIAAFAGWRLPS
ncbi:MAG: TMEM165/GDT1 family protein [Alphaproteobacteria bacterium]|nr:TMEM165/GDT1 family protein [Alphaproteobacteria bacterium]